MRFSFPKLIWFLLALGMVIFGLLAAPALTTTLTGADGAAQTVLSPTAWIPPAIVLIGGLTLLTVFTGIRPAPLAAALAWLRARPVLFWFLLLVYVCLALGWWVYKEQPTYGRELKPEEFAYLCAITWGFFGLIGYNLNRETARTMGSRIGQSKLSGLLIMLTTIVIIFWAAEGYLRRFYITTDGYGFTAMNYWWYQNFYKKNLNSLGYRDYEPMPDDPSLTRIAVVGDSFTAGHGIDNIDNTFPQLLEKQLGPGYDVNLVAQSGWDSIDHTAWLDAYYKNLAPRLPQIVVLSYYLNDIDYLLKDDQDPNTVFSFLDLNRPAGWFVLNYFVPNYIYYNLAQFTSPVRNTNFTDRLIRAHLDPALWAQHEVYLQQFYQWTVDHNARLIVLLWPQIAAVKESQPALQPVRDFFTARGVEIADMSPLLAAQNPLDMIVNRFDSHPSIAANRLAADLLYRTITSQ
jgi:hypothetical protein